MTQDDPTLAGLSKAELLEELESTKRRLAELEKLIKAHPGDEEKPPEQPEAGPAAADEEKPSVEEKSDRPAPEEKGAAKTRRMVRMIDVNFVNPFLQAVMDVLSTMANVTATPGKPFLKENLVAKGDVTGLIGVTGETNGTISVTFSNRCARTVVGNMLGEKISDLNDEVYDGVGELTNMISGLAREGLSKIGMPMKAAIPSVIHGKDHVIKHLSSSPILAIPFGTLYGDIVVEVCMGGQ